MSKKYNHSAYEYAEAGTQGSIDLLADGWEICSHAEWVSISGVDDRTYDDWEPSIILKRAK